MAYTNNGYQRSLTIVVKRVVDGEVESTTEYDGRLAFGSYGAISNTELAQMSYEDYKQRLDDFVRYVEELVPGLNVAEALQPGSEARRYNTSACPIN